MMRKHKNLQQKREEKDEKESKRENRHTMKLRANANKAVEYSRASKTFSAYDLVKTSAPQQHRQ